MLPSKELKKKTWLREQNSTKEKSDKSSPCLDAHHKDAKAEFFSSLQQSGVPSHLPGVRDTSLNRFLTLLDSSTSNDQEEFSTHDKITLESHELVQSDEEPCEEERGAPFIPSFTQENTSRDSVLLEKELCNDLSEESDEAHGLDDPHHDSSHETLSFQNESQPCGSSPQRSAKNSASGLTGMKHEEPFCFESFNALIPQPVAEIQIDPSGTVLNCPGFAPYRSRDRNSLELKKLVDKFPRSFLSWLDHSEEKLHRPDDFSVPHEFHLLNGWKKTLRGSLAMENALWKTYRNPFTQQDHLLRLSTFFRLLSSYVDVHYTEQTFDVSAPIRSLVALHSLNHLLKTKANLARHNAMLTDYISSRQTRRDVNLMDEGRSMKRSRDKKEKVKFSRKKKKNLHDETESINVKESHCSSDTNPPGPWEGSGYISQDLDDLQDKLRDQGFTQPRILWLTPTRHTAKCIVETLLELTPRVKQVRHRKRFEREFGLDPEEKEDGSAPKNTCSVHLAQELLDAGKPPDYAELFRGNHCDQFRLGLRIHTSGVTLYAPLYKSDIILASPLGLHLVIGSEGAARRDYDFLSSIEIVVVDRADVLQMQNWTYVEEIFKVLNNKPQKWQNECDIRRLRYTYSDGLASQLRQTIVLSYKRLPEALGLFHSQSTPLCCNFRGLVNLSHLVSEECMAEQARLQVAKQVLMKIPCQSLQHLYEALLNFLNTQFPPSFLAPISPTDATGSRLLLVVPTYVDYLRVRHVLKTSQHLAKDSRNFSCFRACHEYSSNRMLSRSRHMFLTGQVNLLITTERFLFYRRYVLKGADHVVFLRPLYYPSIYLLCLKGLNDPSRALAVTLFTRFDFVFIEKYVPLEKARMLCNSLTDVPKVFILNHSIS